MCIPILIYDHPTIREWGGREPLKILAIVLVYILARRQNTPYDLRTHPENIEGSAQERIGHWFQGIPPFIFQYRRGIFRVIAISKYIQIIYNYVNLYDLTQGKSTEENHHRLNSEIGSYYNKYTVQIVCPLAHFLYLPLCWAMTDYESLPPAIIEKIEQEAARTLWVTQKMQTDDCHPSTDSGQAIALANGAIDT